MLKKAHLAMDIRDLSYLESVTKDELILGSARVTITSKAFASGSKYASASSSSTTTSDGLIAKGAGFARAVGTHTTAKVTAEGNASLVIKRIKSKFSKNSVTASGFVIATNWF